jgi:hypothetical protein
LALYKTSENVWKDGVSGGGVTRWYLDFVIDVSEILLHFTECWVWFLLCNVGTIEVLGVFSINCGETEIILLDERWIKRIEIKHHDNVIIESCFWFQNQSSTILGLLSFTFSTGTWTFSLSNIFISEFHLLSFFCIEGLLVWTQIFLPTEFVHQEHLVSLGTSVLE